ncbi:MAG TPA: alpha/beta hydrolase [Solirubrobacteraceae bacterium]
MQNEIAVTRDVIYKREPDHDLPLDVYEPSSYLATIVDIHGGGWFHGDKAKDEDLATRLAQSGFRVVVPNYSLTPAYHFPAGVDDVLDAGAWAQSTAAAGLKKVAFIGSSAGGNLAVEAALATGQPGVSWSGPIDLAGFIKETDGTAAADAPAEDYSKISSADINQGGRNDGFLRWVILENVANDRSRLPDATPLNRAVSTSGPIYMANSIGEFVPPDGALAMQRALLDVGVESIAHVIPGTQHAKGYMDIAFDSSLTFLKRTLDV